MADDDPIVERLAREMRTAAPLSLTIAPMTVFQLAGLVQLATRHPQLSEDLRLAARWFVAHARQHFVDGNCRAVVAVIDRGDDHEEDRPWRT